MSDYEIERIDPAEARPLRRALLHPALPPGAVDHEADTDPAARHVGAFKDGALVGIASIHPQPMPSATNPGAWRLRDVAVEHGHRGRGLGAWLVDRCLEHASGTDGAVVWCTARVGAYGFFEHLGFRRAGAPIDDPQDGPQYLMYTELGPAEKSWSL